MVKGVIPEGASFSTGLKGRAFCYGKTATSGNVVLTLAIERGDTDIDSDSFATGVDSSSTAVAGTSGIGFWVAVDLSGSEIDSLAAGDKFRAKLSRKTSGVSGNMTGDLQISVFEIQQR